MKYKKLISMLAIASLLLPAGIAYARPGNGNSDHGAGKYKYMMALGTGNDHEEDSKLEDELKDQEQEREEQEEAKIEEENELNEQEREAQGESQENDSQQSEQQLEKEVRQREEIQVREEVQNAGLEKFQGRIRVKKKEIKFDVPPVIKDGRTLIPVRAVTEGLGAAVNWDEAANAVTITKNGITVVLIPGSTEVTVNGTKINLDVPALLISNRTFVPLRFLGEVFKDEVNYDEGSGDIEIEESNSTTTPETPVSTTPTTPEAPAGTSTGTSSTPATT
ncbi:copper amine oxidase N-terminal domain-containing protein [Moorella sulfitireducens (nom. illeg.)]|uniref:copper amine oxidase N-terminal domain-containing protein n=1 Tax=Neomoorella sulfitireducens TaxID=2972948 RepID=UPI0021AC2B4E|nr:copper amine oxidase N-terminal domain-containing protein [Moorella sulfitireducens]